MNIYFTADNHFGSERHLELSKRPFPNVAEMDKSMIARWNDVVKKDDTVYHLGDFGNPEVILQLNGKKFMIQGNYDDKETVRYLRKYVGFLPSGYTFKVPAVEDYSKYYIIDKDDDVVQLGDINTMTLQLVHETSKALPITDAFVLFAHIHQLQMVKRNGLNVGVDCHNFTPVDLKNVLFWKNAIENHYDEEVFLPEVGI